MLPQYNFLILITLLIWHNTQLFPFNYESHMAMRPEVRRRALVLIIFAIIQWLFMRYIVDNQLFNLTTSNRILFFCVSSLGGAFIIFVGLIYMVLKGNKE